MPVPVSTRRHPWLSRAAFSFVLPLGCSSPQADDDETSSDADTSSAGDGTSTSESGEEESPVYVELPGGAVGIGLDDLRFSESLDRIVVAAGRTGMVDLVDPDTLEVTSISGFAFFPSFDGSDLQGVESADEGRGLIFANDRSTFRLGVVDPLRETIVGAVELEQTEPDYVRWVEATSEVWITNPGLDRIQVLSVPQADPPVPVHAAFIDVPGGVEGLAIDPPRNRAYTHSSGGVLTVIDIGMRTVVATWSTGCSSEHGIPHVDEARGLVFAGCASAEVVVLDGEADGEVLGSYAGGAGTTILAYSPSLRHFYLRGDPGTEVAILGIPDSGVPELLGTLTTTEKGHCAAADNRGHVWVCDWDKGRLIRFVDPHPATE